MTRSHAPRRWRLLLVSPRSGVENMARDSGLLDRARETGEIVFSVYEWARPTLSLGRNQTARGKYDLAEAARRGIDIVRRPTGGRALLHHREITYSVSAPVSGTEPLAVSYRQINRILIDGLRRLGVIAEESLPNEPAPRPGILPCFAAPAEGELVTGGAKLAGSAQVRENGSLLQHGSILIEDDQPLIEELLVGARRLDPMPRAATLSSALGRMPGMDEMTNALFAAVTSLEDAHAAMLDESETREFTARHMEKYASEWWTWRK